MIGIKVDKRTSLDKALKMLKEKVKNAKIMELYKEHQYYIKPSEKKNLKNRQQKKSKKFFDK